MAAPPGDSAPNGGVGGAFRRRRHRSHQATPYDRPLSSLRNPLSSDAGWLSKIVDPASKIITTGAHRLFSSVFRKRLLPRPEQSKGEIQKPRDSHPEAAAAAAEDLSGAHEGVVNRSTVQNTNIQANGVTELEHILKQKTFTRSEIDRLMALLHARTSDSSDGAREERIELKSHDSQADHARQGDPVDGGLQKNIVNTPFLRAAITTPVSRSKLNEDAVASPAEVAKAYMGNRPTKVSPSLLGSQSQAQREEVPEFKSTFHLRTPRVSQMQKPLLTFGNTESTFIAPRSRGRSAIYHMARTPYSRAQPTGALKGSGSRMDACDEPSSSSQKALKRRYSVLENDIGSVGPIRRTRQKSNLLHPKSLAVPLSSSHLLTQGIASDAARASSSFTQTPSSYSFLKSQVDMGEKNVPISASRVSSKSSEMGERILQQLERLTPPKKLSGKQPEVPGRSSSMELTPDMLHGQARRSLETVDTLGLLENVRDRGKEVGSVDPAASNMQTKFALKKDMVDGEISSKTFIIPSKLENDEAKLSSKSTPELAKATSSVVSNSAADASKRTRTFQISVPEDYLDMDDDVHTNGFASSSMNGGKQLMEKSDVPSVASEIPENPNVLGLNKRDKTPMFSELEPSDLLNKQASPEPFVLKPTATGQIFASSLPIALGFSSTPSAAAESVSAPQTTTTVDKSAFASPASSVGINGSDKVSAVVFSTSTSAVEASVSADAKPHLFSSTGSFSTTTADATKILLGSENKITEATDTFKKSKSIPVSSVSGPSTGIFSFGAPATNSTATNGFFSSSTGTSVTLSSPAFFSNQSSSNGFGQVNFTASSVAPTATANAPITGSLTTSTAFPSFSSSPTVKEGSSSVASASELSVSFTDTSGSAAKLKEFCFGSNPVNLSSSATDTGPKSTGFQVEASTSGILSQASNNDNSNKPIFGNLNNTATAFGTMTQSAPSQSTSSTMSPASSGLSGSVFGSSTPALSSGFTFGSSSSSSLSTTASASTTSGSTGIFGSSWQAPDSAASFSSTNSKASSGFAFGVSPSTSIPAVTASTGFTFGLSSSSAPASNLSSGFSFGASSSSSTSAQTSTTLSGLSFGASSSSSTSAQTSNTSSGFSFGNPANNGTPPVFNFGTFSTSAPASTITSSSPFQFGASSGSALTSSSTSMFNSVTPPAPGFSFGAAPTSSITPQPSPQPVFGNGGSVFPFGSAPSPSGNGNQMSMEDTMAEDSTPPPPAQQQPSSAFVFGTPLAQPMATNPFQFSGQQNQVGAPLNSSPFQVPGSGGGSSFELGAGGSFSLGAVGNDKANRKIVKVKSKFRRK